VDHQKSQSPQNFLQGTLRNGQSAFNRDDDLGWFPTVTKDRRSRRASLLDRGGGNQCRIVPLSMKILSSFWFFGSQVCHFPLLILFAKHLNQDSSLMSVDCTAVLLYWENAMIRKLCPTLRLQSSKTNGI
jgi:hypothetical protein